MRAADERASESPDPAKIGVRPGAKWKNISIMYNSLINCGPSGDGMAENRIKRIILSEYAPNGILRRIQTIQITCMKKLLIFFLPAILLGCDSPAYRNPLDVAFGDPFILHAADGKFYMYGTSGDIRGFSRLRLGRPRYLAEGRCRLRRQCLGMGNRLLLGARSV